MSERKRSKPFDPEVYVRDMASQYADEQKPVIFSILGPLHGDDELFISAKIATHDLVAGAFLAGYHARKDAETE